VFGVLLWIFNDRLKHLSASEQILEIASKHLTKLRQNSLVWFFWSTLYIKIKERYNICCRWGEKTEQDLRVAVKCVISRDDRKERTLNTSPYRPVPRCRCNSLSSSSSSLRPFCAMPPNYIGDSRRAGAYHPQSTAIPIDAQASQ